MRHDMSSLSWDAFWQRMALQRAQLATPGHEGRQHGAESLRLGIPYGLKVKFDEQREGWVLLKIPRGDIDGVGEVK